MSEPNPPLPETHGSVVLVDPDDVYDAMAAYMFDSTHGAWFGSGGLGAVSTFWLERQCRDYGYEILKEVVA